MLNINNQFLIQNRVAIVTGACGLLGRNHCEALAEAGGIIVVADIDESKAKSYAQQLGSKHLGISIDVADKKSVEFCKTEIIKKFGTIDILVNNAAINDMFENPALAAEQSKFENYPLEMWQKSLDVNITGVFLCSQVFGSVMASNGTGSIINIASTYGMVGPDQTIYQNKEGEQAFYKSAAYPATKGAVINFTRFLASYWGKKGIRVNTISPGGVENNQNEWFVKNYSNKTPLGRMAEPTDYKGALVFLASDASSYMTGANLVVDGGWTCI